MARTSAAQQAAADEMIVGVVTMIRLVFPSGTTALNNGTSTISWNGDDYLAVGDFGSIDKIRESGDMRPNPLRATLSGLDATAIALATDEEYQDGAAEVFIQLYDATDAAAGDPLKIWGGTMDQLSVELDGGIGRVTVLCEGAFADYQRPRVSYYTDADQQEKWPGDRGMEHVSAMADKIIDWGGQRIASPYLGGATNSGDNMGRLRQRD